MYIYIYTYVYIYIYIFMYIYIYMCMYMYLNTSKSISIFCISIIFIYIYIYLYICNVCIDVCMYVYKYMYVCTYLEKTYCVDPVLMGMLTNKLGVSIQPTCRLQFVAGRIIERSGKRVSKSHLQVRRKRLK